MMIHYSHHIGASSWKIVPNKSSIPHPSTMVPTDDDLRGSTWRLAYTNDDYIVTPSRRMVYLQFSNHHSRIDTIQYSFHTDKSGWSDAEAE